MDDRDGVSRNELLEILDDLRARVESGDSWEGSLRYRLRSGRDSECAFEVRAAYQVVNAAGQGETRTIRAEPRTFQSYEIEDDPSSFVGKRVTLAGKDPIRWERTTITGYDAASGELVLAGGHRVTRVFDPSPDRAPVTEDRVYPHDIARGIVHR